MTCDEVVPPTLFHCKLAQGLHETSGLTPIRATFWETQLLHTRVVEQAESYTGPITRNSPERHEVARSIFPSLHLAVHDTGILSLAVYVMHLHLG